MSATRTIKIPQTETEIAVLQVQVQNIENDVSDIKSELKEVKASIKESNGETQQLLRDMKEDNVTAHQAMSAKISALEKWRWMMMGAGIVIGSLGFDTVAKLLK